MKKLIIIDVQNDFVTGSLGSVEAMAIVSNVVKRVKEYKSADIIFTRDTHYEDYAKTLEGEKLPVMHCVKGTDGWQIVSPLQPYSNKSVVIDKPTFGSTHLCHILKEASDLEQRLNRGTPDEFEICGLCTDICVISNALLIRASFPNAKITVRANCCAGVTPELHEAALKIMKSCQIDVIR